MKVGASKLVVDEPAQRTIAVSLRPYRSPWRDVLRTTMSNRRSVAGLLIIGAVVVGTLMADAVAPHDPYRGQLVDRLQRPDSGFFFGTDELGRDILSRVVHGTRISLGVALVATGISVSIGLLVGAVAGYVGGWVDNLIMRISDVFLAFPSLVLAITMVAVFGASLWNVMIALGLTAWVGYARVIRGSFLSLKEQPFVEASRAVGASPARIIFRHMIPNALAPIIVIATLGMGYMIVGEASLSYLGLGAQPPTASWGSMLASGRNYMQVAPWVAAFPGAAIIITVLGFNMLGDALRDVLDPRLRGVS